MCVETTAAKCSKLHRSGMKEGVQRLQPPPCSTDHDDMSLPMNLRHPVGRGSRRALIFSTEQRMWWRFIRKMNHLFGGQCLLRSFSTCASRETRISAAQVH